MKVYISNYRNHWISPYKIIEWVLRREIDYDDPKIERWVNRLEPVSALINRVLNFVHPPIRYIKIDRYDVWSMESTLASIILPMLIELKRQKQGSPFVDPQDVPFTLYPVNDPENNPNDTDDTHHERWDWIMDELIWTFTQLQPDADWESQFHSGNIDWVSVPCAWDSEGKPTLYQMEKGPNDTHEFDAEGYTRHQQRISNGLRLFGKYYQGLWD